MENNRLVTQGVTNVERIYVCIDGKVQMVKLVHKLTTDDIQRNPWLNKLPGHPDRTLRVISKPMTTLFATTFTLPLTGLNITVGFGIIATGVNSVPTATAMVLRYDTQWWTMTADVEAMRQLLTLITGDDRVALAVGTWRAVHANDVPWYASNRLAVTKLLRRRLLRPLTTVTVDDMRVLAWPELFSGLPVDERDKATATGEFTLLLAPNGGEPQWSNPLDHAYALGLVHENMRAVPEPTWMIMDNYALDLDYQRNLITPWCRYRGKWMLIPFHSSVRAYAECVCTVAPQVLAAHELAGRPRAHELLLNELRKIHKAYTNTLRRVSGK